MKKLLLLAPLAPIVLSLASCSDALRDKVEKAYKHYYQGDDIVRMEKILEHDEISQWFIMAEKKYTDSFGQSGKLIYCGEYIYNSYSDTLTICWNMYTWGEVE
jgi:vacuolar-type H+-ATPase subunit B/Vma2